MAERIEGFAIGLDLDTVNVSSGLQDLKGKLQTVASEMKANMSAFDRGDKSLEKYRTRVDGLNKKLEVQKTITESAKQSYEKMVAEHGAGSVEAERAAREYNKQAAELNNLSRYVDNVTAELKEMTDQQRLADSGFTKFGDKMQSMGGKMTAVGDRMKGIGKNMSLYVTAPLVGVGVAAVKTSIDFEAQMSRVGAIAEATGDDMKRLKDSALELGASTSKSASEVAAGQEELAAMGFTVNEIIGAMPGVISAAEASGADMAQTASVMASSLNMFGLEAAEANRVADILAQTANVSAADITDMQYALKYAGPPAAALGVSMEELSAAIGLMTDAGMKGEQAGTTLRGALLGLLDPSEENSKMMDKMGITITDNEGNFVGLSNLIRNLQESMEGQTETQKAATLSALVGKEAVSGMLTLMKQGPDKINEFTYSLENSAGASKKAADVMRDNLKGALDEMGGAFETASIEVGTILTPMLRKAAGWVQALTQRFIDMSPEAKKTALVVAGIAAAIGPVLVVGGTLLAALGSIFTFIGSVSAAAGVLTTGVASAIPMVNGLAAAFTILTGPIGLTVAAVAALTVGTVALVNHLKKDALPEVDRFGNGVSESTQKALGGFFKLSDGASAQMSELTITSSKVTQEMATNLSGKFKKMNDEILAGMKKRHADQIADMEGFFANSSALTSEREAEILRKQKVHDQARETEQRAAGERVNHILQNAANQKRELTESEKDQINAIQEQMNQNAVKYLTDNERDQKVILENMRNQAEAMSARQAADVAKNSAKQRDKVIKDAEAQFNDTVAFAIKQRDETGAMTAEEADAVIREATKKRDGSVKQAKDTHAEVVAEAKKQAGDHVKEVDWETGQVLSKWQVYKNDVGKRVKESGKEIKDAFSGMWSSIKKNTDEGTQRTKDDWNKLSTSVKGFASDMGTKAAASIDKLKTGVITKTAELSTSAVNKWKSTRDSVTGTASDLSKRATASYEGLRKSIIDKSEQLRSGTVQKWNQVRDGVTGVLTTTKKKALGIFDDIVGGATALPGKMKTGIVRMGGEVVAGIRSIGQRMADMFGKVINGIIGGLNSVTSKLGIKATVSKWSVPQFHGGTDSHKGGLMVVGDKYGRELVELPDGRTFLSPDTDTLLDAPKGTRVIPNKLTEKYLKGDVPYYAKGAGVGSWIKDKAAGFSSALSGIWDYVKNPAKLLDLMPIPKWDTGLAGGFATVAKGALSVVKDRAVEYIKGAFAKSEGELGSKGGFPSPFRLTSRAGMRMHPILKRPMMHEGDDWGAPVGTPIPSRSAGRVTQSGFHAIRGNYVRVKSGQYDMIYQHNTKNLVGVGDQVRPGQPVGLVGSTGRSTGPHLHFEVRKGGAFVAPKSLGFKTGGLVRDPGMYNLAEEKGHPEFVIPTKPSRRTEAMKLLALAGRAIMGNRSGGGNRTPGQLPNPGGGYGGGGDIVTLLLEQNELLRALLLKDTSLYMDSEEVGAAVAPAVSRAISARQGMKNLLGGRG